MSNVTPHSTQDEILRQRLLDAAKALARQKQWPWLEPVEVTEVVRKPRSRRLEVRTNTGARGRSIRVVLAENGPDLEVIDSGYLPR